MTNGRRGIALLEILIASVLLVLGVIPALGLFSGEERETGFLRQKLVVHNRIRELAESAEDRCLAGHLKDRAFEEGPRPATVPDGITGLEITERVQVWPSHRTPGLYQVRVEVEWKDPTDPRRMVRKESLTRFLCDPEWGLRHQEPDKLLVAEARP